MAENDPTPTPAQSPEPAASDPTPPTDPTPADPSSDPPADPPADPAPSDPAADPPDPADPADPAPDVPVNSPGDYQITLPEGRTEDVSLVAGLRQVAFANGFNQKEFQAIVDLHEQGVSAQKDAQAQLQKDWKADLTQRWKDDYEPNTAAIRDFVTKFGNEGLNKLADQTGFLKNPDIAELFLMLNNAVSEDSLILGDGKSGKSMVKARSAGGSPVLSFPSMEKK